MDHTSLKPIQKITFKNTTELYRSYMPFIKGGGLFLNFNYEITPNNIEPQETIIAILTLPNFSESITVKGEVVWINTNTHNKGYGITLSNIGENTSLNAKDIIEQLINDPKLKNERRYTF